MLFARPLALFATILVFRLMIAGVASPDTWHHVKRIVLGKSGPSRLIADIEFENTGPDDFGEFYVAFQTSQASSTKKIVMDTGAGTLTNVRIDAQDYVHLGRRQLFISSHMGRDYALILDYDGKRLRTLYSPLGGRVGTRAVRTKRGDWRLVESWSIYQYTDGTEDLGTGFKRGKYEIIRTLRWRHGRFVPIFPGPTTIK